MGPVGSPRTGGECDGCRKGRCGLIFRHPQSSGTTTPDKIYRGRFEMSGVKWLFQVAFTPEAGQRKMPTAYQRPSWTFRRKHQLQRQCHKWRHRRRPFGIKRFLGYVYEKWQRLSGCLGASGRCANSVQRVFVRWASDSARGPESRAERSYFAPIADRTRAPREQNEFPFTAANHPCGRGMRGALRR